MRIGHQVVTFLIISYALLWSGIEAFKKYLIRSSWNHHVPARLIILFMKIIVYLTEKKWQECPIRNRYVKFDTQGQKPPTQTR